MVIPLLALAYGISFFLPRSEKITALTHEISDPSHDENTEVPITPPIGNMTFTHAYNGGNCGGCAFILANGKITPDTPDAFQNFLNDLEKEEVPSHGLTVYLNSPGGSISGAIKLGDLIRTNNLNTTIGHAQRSTDPADGSAHAFLESASCNSACVLSFVGGVHRFYRAESEEPPRWYVGSGSQNLILRDLLDDIASEIGRPDTTDYLSGVHDGLRSSGKINEYLSRIGLDPSAIFDGLSRTGSPDNILTQSQAYDLKITNTPPSPLVWTLSQMGPRLELRTNSVIENHPVGYRFLCTASNPPRISLIIEIQNLHFIYWADLDTYFKDAIWKQFFVTSYRTGIPAQIIHRRKYAAGLVRNARGAQPHLHTAQCAGQLQVTEIAQMANAEDAVIQLAKPVTQAHVEAFQDGGA